MSTFQLWFLRDLILIVYIIAPLSFLAQKTTIGKCISSLVFLICAIVISQSSFMWSQFAGRFAMSCFWFLVGNLMIPILLNAKKGILLYASIILFLVDMSLFFLGNGSIKCFGLEYVVYFSELYVFFYIYKLICSISSPTSNINLWSLLRNATFFIYLYHEPALNIVRKLIVSPLLHINKSMAFAVSYMISPWLFAILAALIALGVCRVVPRFYAILVGGRSLI